MRWTIKHFFFCLFSVGLFVVTAVFFALSSVTALQSALLSTHAQVISASYFVHSPACTAREKQTLSLFDLPYVEGEQVRYRTTDGEGFAEEVLSIFHATCVWKEVVDGVTSYYASSQKLPKSVLVSGALVNLHIAVKEDEVVVGTPIIFGGY